MKEDGKSYQFQIDEAWPTQIIVLPQDLLVGQSLTDTRSDSYLPPPQSIVDCLVSIDRFHQFLTSPLNLR